MKQKTTVLNTTENKNILELDAEDQLGENHIGTSLETPMRTDAFKLSDKDKIDKISYHFQEIMQALGLDLNDDSLSGTPQRVAKMYVKEIFKGLNPANKPKIAHFLKQVQLQANTGRKKHYFVFQLRASFCSDYRKGSCCLHFFWKNHRLVEVK